MNDSEMKGCVRASEVVAAYEATWSGEHLLFALSQEHAHAHRVAINTRLPQATRDEWRARRQMYRAAIRRLQDKAVSRVA